ncbi:MAG TPA: hypothetical protein VGE08_01850 [Steroidobacter sp.]
MKNSLFFQAFNCHKDATREALPEAARWAGLVAFVAHAQQIGLTTFR